MFFQFVHERRWPTVFGYMLFTGTMAAGYFYNVTFIQLGLTDLCRRTLQMSAEPTALTMAMLALLSLIIALAFGYWLMKTGRSENFRLKLWTTFGVVVGQTLLTLLATAITSPTALFIWIFFASLALGLGMPATFSLTLDLIPRPDRGIVAGLITAGAYFASNAFSSATWHMEHFRQLAQAFVPQDENPPCGIIGEACTRDSYHFSIRPHDETNEPITQISQDGNTMIPASKEFAIETIGLKKVYQRGSQSISALEQLDLLVPKHSIFGFLGPNGAGKTTTMKLLLGLTRPSSGSIRIFGKDLHQNPSILTQIGYMPQSPRFYPHLTARQTLRFCARFYPQCRTSQLEKRIDEMLALVGLENRADRPVGGFSGGERQRLGLAQAQIHQPDLLILDEPAAALDPVGRYDMLRIMDRLREQTTIFYSTHILDDVQQVSDSVAILKHGKLVAQGSIHSLLSNDETVYQIQFKGPAEPTYTRLIESSWVQRVEFLPYGDPSSELQDWQIFVDNEQAAQTNILPLLNNGQNLQLIAFFQKKVELEQIFLDLVHGEPV